MHERRSGARSRPHFVHDRRRVAGAERHEAPARVPWSLAFPLRVTSAPRRGLRRGRTYGGPGECVNVAASVPVDTGGDAVGTPRHVVVDGPCTQLWKSLLMIVRHATRPA